MKLTTTQAKALDLLRSTERVGEAGTSTGPVVFTVHNGDTRRQWPLWGPAISTYRALVRKGFAVEAPCEYGGLPAIQFEAIEEVSLKAR